MDNFPEVHRSETNPPAEAPSAKTIQIKINLKKAVRAGIILGIIVVVALAVYFLKGFVIAATVNGSPISRLAVISELEKISGKNVLESLVLKKLIKAEISKNNITVSAEEVAAEIAKIGENIKAQGQDLTQALTEAGMTMADLEKQIREQKEVEKLLGDKITVTGEEVANYIKEYKVPVAKGKEVEVNSQIQEQLRQQKLSGEYQKLTESLKSAAKIRYFVKY